jgi:hypothetical protein
MRPRWNQTAMVFVALGACVVGAVPAAGQTKPPGAQPTATAGAPATAQPAGAKTGAPATAQPAGAKTGAPATALPAGAKTGAPAIPAPGTAAAPKATAGVKAGAPAPSGLPSAAPTASASADPNAPRDPREVYKDAVTAFEAGDYQKAYEGFKEVWATEKKPKVVGNLGRAELKIGKYRDAAEHLDMFLKQDDQMTADERRQVYALLGEAKKNITTLRLVILPEGAEVLVDGAKIGTSPIEGDVYLEPGKHTVVAQLGAATQKTDIDTKAGAGEEVVKINLQPPTAPTATATATATGLVSSIKIPREAYIIAGGGVVALLGGILMGAASGQKGQAEKDAPRNIDDQLICSKDPKKDLGGKNTDCDKIRSLASSGDTMWGVGVAFLVVGLGAAAGGGVLFALPRLTGSAEPAKPTSRLVPVVGTDRAGLMWQGSF